MKPFRGFTLIELLIVIAIIGLLASIALVSLNMARDKARDAQRLSDLDGISKALELYYSTNNKYPYYDGITKTIIQSDSANAWSTFLSEINQNTSWQDPVKIAPYIYVYTINSDGSASISVSLKLRPSAGSFEMGYFGGTRYYIATKNLAK